MPLPRSRTVSRINRMRQVSVGIRQAQGCGRIYSGDENRQAPLFFSSFGCHRVRSRYRHRRSSGCFFVFKAPLADKISVITGLAAESLEQKLRSKTPPLDFIFLDADRSSYPEYLRLTPKLSRPGTVIVWTNLSGRSNLQNRKRVVFFNTHTPVARYLRAF
jgi:hypothetical protein